MSTTAKERFNQMMERCENLLRASDKSEVLDAVRDDMRRSVVMFAVSALDAYASDRFMEDFIKHIKGRKLSKIEVELLVDSGISVEVALELLSKRQKRPYRVIRSYVEKHFAKMSMQSFDSINLLYKYLGLKHIVDDALKNAEWKTLNKKIKAMLGRRHKIVHEGDYDGKHSLRDIDRGDVERWLKATRMLVESMEEIVKKCVQNNCHSHARKARKGVK